MGYPNLGNYADMLHLDPEFDPNALPGDGASIDLFDFADPYAPTSPEDQARLDFERMLQLLLDEAGSM
ncbi:hypothetical protein OV207_34465 [Corallococcus sp. BB11-1]|uniref:hypothetical protein n=1 Tax=Corallococcus sp. BB11-1 TaxID=2996783 RepID=UPI0022713B12|nr:hypothetical protein [Corallococcus sp. BB11-1]MCY1036592.1 hypothetical protein [Corallococcus sp. BB11-1]